jgi:GntR family transcriptional repressor for pyruvate dehydrogenase complex
MSVTKGYESMRADFMDQVRIEHRAILAAIAAGDAAGARRAAIEHHLNGEQRLVTSGAIKAPRAHRVRPVR